MSDNDPKDVLARYLAAGREAVLWKLEGVSEYDARRPLAPSGTNLLGLVKHLASVEAGYLGATFGRPFPEPSGFDEADPESDLYAAEGETPDGIVALYRRVQAHSEATLAVLDLDAPGTVPWWPADRGPVTLQRILVHLIAETHRHAGHADILREQLDGFAGLTAGNENLGTTDPGDRRAHHDRLESLAQRFR